MKFRSSLSRVAAWVAITTVVLASAQLAQADGTTIKGTFKYDGKAPTPSAIKVDKDTAFCGPFNLKDESLVVNSENGGVKNVVVYLYVSPTGKKPPVTDEAKKALAESVRLDNDKCRFEPRVVAITVDQALTIGNKDSVAHNSKIDVLNPANVAANPIIPAGKDYEHKFNAEERLPIPVSCSIHPWMNAYVLIKDTPYFAVTDENGNFEIKGVPPGDWTFRFWHENVGYVQKVKMSGKSTTLKRGEYKVKVAQGKDEIEIPAVTSKYAK